VSFTVTAAIKASGIFGSAAFVMLCLIVLVVVAVLVISLANEGTVIVGS
jgi:hypothetical protein